MVLVSKDFENKIKELGYNIKDLGSDGRPKELYDGCNWWRLGYKFLYYSIYYDPKNVIGFVGEPYWEFYDGEETYRYTVTNNFDSLIKLLEKLKLKQEKDIKNTPEIFL